MGWEAARDDDSSASLTATPAGRTIVGEQESGRTEDRPGIPCSRRDMPYSLLVVEDDTNTREYFAEALRGVDGSFKVKTAASLRQGLEELQRQWPDVMLVDIGLPDGSGLDLIRRARELSADILSLVITVFGDETTVVDAIEAGAQGYLLKSEAPDDLRESVNQVLLGGAPISPGVASHLLRRFRTLEAAGAERDSEAGLTPREREVLELLVRGLLYQEAAEQLGITRNTVTTHVKGIYRKLRVNTRGEAVFEALSKGLVKVGPKS